MLRPTHSSMGLNSVIKLNKSRHFRDFLDSEYDNSIYGRVRRSVRNRKWDGFQTELDDKT